MLIESDVGQRSKSNKFIPLPPEPPPPSRVGEQEDVEQEKKYLSKVEVEKLSNQIC